MRWSTTGFWSSAACSSSPRRRSPSAGGSARSITPRTATTRCPGSTRSPWTSRKNSSAAYLQATFDWHIDGCTPIEDEYPQKATVLSAVQVAEWGGETEFANSYAAYDALTDEEKERFGSPARRALAGGVAAARQPRSDPRTVGAVAIPPYPRASTGLDAPQRPQVAGAGRLRRLRRRHGPRRGSRAARPSCSSAPPCPTTSTATPGRSATPSSGTTAASCTGPPPTTPARRARCCAPPSWVTNRSSRGIANDHRPERGHAASDGINLGD